MLNYLFTPGQKIIKKGIVLSHVAFVANRNSLGASKRLGNDMIERNASVKWPDVPVLSTYITGEGATRIVSPSIKNGVMAVAKAPGIVRETA